MPTGSVTSTLSKPKKKTTRTRLLNTKQMMAPNPATVSKADGKSIKKISLLPRSVLILIIVLFVVAHFVTVMMAILLFSISLFNTLSLNIRTVAANHV